MNIWQGYGLQPPQRIEPTYVEVTEGYIEFKRITSIMREWLREEGVDLISRLDGEWVVGKTGLVEDRVFFSYSDALQCALNLLDEMQVVE